MAEVSGGGKASREINAEIKRLIAQGETDILVRDPGARHNLGVAVLQPLRLTFDGSVGYYCAGLCDGPMVEIRGDTGWGVAESMLNGTIIVHGSAGNGAAAAIRGGAVVVHGDAAARAGVSMKGGLLLIAGNCGYMAGFMAQKGALIVCGDTGEAFADSMYETVCYVGGRIAELGNDAVVAELTAEDVAFLKSTFSRYFGGETSKSGRRIPRPHDFKKIVAGRKLWNFDKREWATWKEAL
ncbi:MAG: glutamate synthase [Anaerolineae bacterium]|nr:glutamate synthase [Anaerolineae bacterium]